MRNDFKINKRYQPKGFDILYEDRDIIVGNKAAGMLTVGAAWNRDNTVHALLNQYVRKGNSKSRKCVYVVHRLDQATSGVLIFAKSEEAKVRLKNAWKDTKKIYDVIVHGRMKKKAGVISSYLEEDEDYVVHSSKTDSGGRLAHTKYEVIKETPKFSLLEIDLLTGRKNQIRVHLAQEGHPVVGDDKYGNDKVKYPGMALHARSIAFNHPFTTERMAFAADTPDFFRKLIAKTAGERPAVSGSPRQPRT